MSGNLSGSVYQTPDMIGILRRRGIDLWIELLYEKSDKMGPDHGKSLLINNLTLFSGLKQPLEAIFSPRNQF